MADRKNPQRKIPGSPVRISFLGGAGEVTGSCYLIETDELRFLVDCGMFQGGHEMEQKNLNALDFDVKTLDFVLLTHAHIDHSGLLPRLTTFGYKGPIYTTTATAELLQVMLPDSAFIQEKEAEWVNKDRRKHTRKPTQETAPLYTVAQAQYCLRQLRPVVYDQEVQPHRQVRCRFRDAGHILGSAIIELWLTADNRTQKLVFSGDLGQPGRPVLCDPTPITEADILFVESTYGNRLHKSLPETLDELVFAINDTLKRKGGNVIVPAFAVGRTQEILYLLADLVRQKRLENLLIYVDSPMATQATEITLRHRELWDAETRELFNWQQQRPQGFSVKFIEDVEESMALNRLHGGAIILSASGMCEAGRIKHHLSHNLGRRECTILITGFQAEGTLGRRLVDRAHTVHIFREEIPVRADIYTIGGLSAHADQKALLDWLGHFRQPPGHSFVVHGEHPIAQGFAEVMRNRLHWEHVEVPIQGHTIVL